MNNATVYSLSVQVWNTSDSHYLKIVDHTVAYECGMVLGVIGFAVYPENILFLILLPFWSDGLVTLRLWGSTILLKGRGILLIWWGVLDLRLMKLFATKFKDVIFHRLECWGIYKPLRRYSMNRFEASIPLKIFFNVWVIDTTNTRLDECIKDHQTLLIDYWDLAWNIETWARETIFRS